MTNPLILTDKQLEEIQNALNYGELHPDATAEDVAMEISTYAQEIIPKLLDIIEGWRRKFLDTTLEGVDKEQKLERALINVLDIAATALNVGKDKKAE